MRHMGKASTLKLILFCWNTITHDLPYVLHICYISENWQECSSQINSLVLDKMKKSMSTSIVFALVICVWAFICRFMSTYIMNIWAYIYFWYHLWADIFKLVFLSDDRFWNLIICVFLGSCSLRCHILVVLYGMH